MRTVFFLLTMMFAFLNVSDVQASHNHSKISHAPKLVEVVLTLPFEDLIINQDGIAVNYEGNLLRVHSMEKKGEYWVVSARGDCPNGHSIVCRCGGCAVSSCGYCCSCYTDYKKGS